MDEEFECPSDPTLIQVEALINLIDAYKTATNHEIRRRLLLAMDAIVAKLYPPGSRGALVEVIGKTR